MRGHALAVAIAVSVSLAGGFATDASGQLVVRRLSLPASPRTAAATKAPRPNAGPARAGLPAALTPQALGTGPAAWARLMEVRAQRQRAMPDFLGRPSTGWSRWTHRRPGWRARFSQLDPCAAPAEITYPDTIRVAFIRIDYQEDRGGPLSSGDGHFDLTGPDSTVAPIDRPPHNRDFYRAHLEALKRYYDAQSYGRAVIVGDVWPHADSAAYSLHDMADFGPWAFGNSIYRAAVAYVRSAFFAADSQSQTVYHDRIPWDQYDRFMIIHAGSDLQSDIKQDSPEDIPTFTIGLGNRDVVVFPDSANCPIDRVCIVPETASQDGFTGAINALVAHENGHNIFGFADLYNVYTGYPVDGYWSLMDSGTNAGAPFSLPNGVEGFATGFLPPSVDPFQRFFTTDALTFRDVDWGSPMSIANGERHPDMRRVFLSSDEYLLLENREIAPTDSISLDQDSTTRVVLGPKSPDRFEYDALLPTLSHEPGTPPPTSGGILVWHIDASNIPFETATRIDPVNDYGYNSGPGPPAITVVEADGLADLGDPSSPLFLGSPYDPFFKTNNRRLDDASVPNLLPRTGTRPHVRLSFLDDPGDTMHVLAERDWQPDGWPVAAEFPPGGPLLLAVDADGAADDHLEVCWAGGSGADSAAIFAVSAGGVPRVLSRILDRRPRPLMAALPIGNPALSPRGGPATFAVSTYADTDGVGAVHGGQVWLIDHLGAARPGWPAALPSIVTTPPVFEGSYPDASVFVGCADGSVYQIGLDGTGVPLLTGISGGVSGRLAIGRGAHGALLVAAGGADGDVAVATFVSSGGGTGTGEGFRRHLGGAGFAPDFLWIDFDAHGNPGTGTPTCGVDTPALIVHGADRLWAFCATGEALPGWGRALGDTLVAGLGAGDPDGDGYPEVLTQSVTSRIAFFNQSGYPSPGWPRAATHEGFRTDSPPLALDVDGDGRAEVVALDASGILAALRGDGHVPAGWPLATGAGAVGSAVAADLDRDGHLEIVAPDREVPRELKADVNGRFGTLYAYTTLQPTAGPSVNAWTMLGGDPGRTSALPALRTGAPAPVAGGPLERGTLHAFPNPARRRPVAFAYRLTEPAQVDFTITDTSGREVASFTRSGRRSDNLEIWDPGLVPAGLYVARLRFRGTTIQSEAVTLGLLR